MEEKLPKTISATMLNELRGDTPRERVLHRLHSVTLVLSGLSASEVARVYGDSPRAVAYWVTRFKKDGLDGLNEEVRPGRPSKLKPSQLKKLQTFLNKSPEKSQMEKAEMTAEFISKQFGIVLTVRQCWRILKRITA
jgi:transposase